jgi:hypothetical protein
MINRIKFFNNVIVFDLFNCFVLQTTGVSDLTKYTVDNFIIKSQNNVFRT